MTHQLIKDINKAALRDDIPDFRAGDSVKVHVRVIEGNKLLVDFEKAGEKRVIDSFVEKA